MTREIAYPAMMSPVSSSLSCRPEAQSLLALFVTVWVEVQVAVAVAVEDEYKDDDEVTDK